MNSSEYKYLQSKKWRAITYDWESLWKQGQNSNLYCLTDFQVAWLLSNTEYMRWSSRWENCPCSQNDLNAMKADLDYNLMSCFDLNPYMLDKVYQDSVNSDFQGMNDRYDSGGIEELNPLSPTDYFNGDDGTARNTALCLACATYVKSYAKNWLQQASLIQGLINVLVSVISPVPYVQDMIVRVISGLVGVNQSDVDAMNNESALDAVICCMIDGLTGVAVSEIRFENSLSGCAFNGGSDNEIVRLIIESDLTNFDNYLSFINELGEAYRYTAEGIEFDCGCGDVVEWSYVEYFGDDFGAWELEVYGAGWNPTTGGALTPPEGMVCTNMEYTVLNPDRWRKRINIKTEFDVSEVTQISVSFTGDQLGDPQSRITARLSGSVVDEEQFNIEDGDVNRVVSLVLSEGTMIDEIEIDLVCGLKNYDQPITEVDCEMNFMSILGVGDKPTQFP